MTTAQVIFFLMLNLIIWIWNWELKYYYLKLRLNIFKKIKVIMNDRKYHNKKLSEKIVEREWNYELN